MSNSGFKWSKEKKFTLTEPPSALFGNIYFQVVDARLVRMSCLEWSRSPLLDKERTELFGLLRAISALRSA
ncbi:MAG: hypothetical protein JW774_03735 [Candidatus Aureabacteria bacterium]|nr:hypothetical protein [Candidatus Auribacterota bacterium]